MDFFENININIPNTKKVTTPLQSRPAPPRKTFGPEINFLEDRFAALTGGTSALAVKSSKSATYLLIKNLLKEGDNIVTVNSISLYKNEVIRERLNIEVRLAEDQSVENLKNLIDNNTKLIFLESLGLENQVIPDFQKIFAFAASKQLPVVVDNTVGLANQIVNPIKLGAHFSIETFSNSLNTGSVLFNSILIQGNYNWGKALFKEYSRGSLSLIDKIRTNSLHRESPSLLPGNLFEHVRQLESLPEKTKKLSHSSLLISRWLREITHIREVDYAGLANHPSHFNALKYFSGGYGNVLSFYIWANFRSFDFFLDNLIPKSFKLFKIININYEQKKITIKVLDDNYENLVVHFRNTFELLQNHLGSDYFLYENLYDMHDAVGY